MSSSFYDVNLFVSEEGKDFHELYKIKNTLMVSYINRAYEEAVQTKIFSEKCIFSFVHYIPGNIYCKSVPIKTAREISLLYRDLFDGSDNKAEKIISIFNSKDIHCLLLFSDQRAKQIIEGYCIDLQYDIIDLGSNRRMVAYCSKKSYTSLLEKKLQGDDNILRSIKVITRDDITKYNDLIKELYNDGIYI